MFRITNFSRLLLIALFVLIISHDYSVLNDKENNVDYTETERIKNSSLYIKKSRFSLVIFVGCSLETIKGSNNIPNTIDTTSIENFTNSLFASMEDYYTSTDRLILIVLKSQGFQFHFKLGQKVQEKLSYEAVDTLYKNEFNFYTGTISKGLANIIDAMANILGKSSKDDRLDFLLWVLIAYAIVVVIYFLSGAIYFEPEDINKTNLLAVEFNTSVNETNETQEIKKDNSNFVDLQKIQPNLTRTHQNAV